MKAPRQKISSVSRWLINIGLTLQFYVPYAVFLYGIGLIAYTVITEMSDIPENVRGWGVELIPIGFGAIAIMIILIMLAITITWCACYLLWDRYGNRFHALCFLIATNVLLGGLWLWAWIDAFAVVPIWWHDPDFWLTSPAPIVIPTLFYIVALWLLFPKNGTDVSELKS